MSLLLISLLFLLLFQVSAQERRSSWSLLAVTLSCVSVVDIIVVFIFVSGATSVIGSGAAIQLASASCQLVIC